MKKVTRTKRLNVSSETIRQLDVKELEVPQGGVGAGSLNNQHGNTCGCPTGNCDQGPYDLM